HVRRRNWVVTPMQSEASNSYRSAHGNGAPDDLLAECCRCLELPLRGAGSDRRWPNTVRTRIEADASRATILTRSTISHVIFKVHGQGSPPNGIMGRQL